MELKEVGRMQLKKKNCFILHSVISFFFREEKHKQNKQHSLTLQTILEKNTKTHKNSYFSSAGSQE